ncbi:MAG: TlpA family protein disulfide reductase [Planctomycetota bacterium]
MASMPQVQVLHSKYAKNPQIVILAMNVGDDNDKMKKWWAEKKYTFPTLNDADELAGAYGIKAFPASIVIGPDGMVLHATVGSAHEVEKQIEEALAGLE